ncbi:MAG: Lipid II flippase FtsW [Chlamydiae bacterium]|nr:Lipid II flippase FtsW [Chlamydiota bacterium]
MVFNTSSAEILDRSLDRDIHSALYKQIAYGCVGFLIAILVWRVGYEDLLKLSLPLFCVGILLLALVFVPGIGQVRNGAHRWIKIGTFTLQPSEFVKLLSLMVFVDAILKQKGKQISLFVFAKIGIILAVPVFLVLIEPDNGTAAVMGVSLLPLFFISNIPIKFWVLPVAILLVIGSFAAYNVPYVRGRLEVYLNPSLDLKGKGHQPHQAKIAAGSGKLFGRGPGGSYQKLTYLPEAQNDYIIAIFAEEFGYIGMIILIALYMCFAAAGFSIAMHCKSLEGRYLASGITFLISLQAFLNLGIVSGLLPSKGVNLPFFSQGGSSLIANIIGLTLLLNIEWKRKKSSSVPEGQEGTSFLRKPLQTN